VLIGLFADRRFRQRDVVAGQYAGLTLLFLVSAAGSLVSLLISSTYLRVLGIFPILVGVKKLVELRKGGEATSSQSATGIASVALVTIANGGDNIGVYMPTFALHSAAQIAAIAVVFVLMTALWCWLAHRLVSHPQLGTPIRRYAHILAPLVLIGLGIAILLPH
jgi:cadmium resistance protein CadD (predicted permease)